MSEIEIGAVRAEDRDAWAALWDAYLAFYGTRRDTAVHEAAFAQLMSDDPATFRGALARIGGRPAGLVHWVWHPHMWRPEGAIYLQDLFVAPDARRGGMGAALIRHVYADADARGVPGVYWLTRADNAPARRLYDAVGSHSGFVRYDRAAA